MRSGQHNGPSVKFRRDSAMALLMWHSHYHIGHQSLSLVKGTGSHVAGSSNRSSSTKNWRGSTTRSRQGRVPDWCGCGCRPVLRWSRTEMHPNKPFFGCPNYNTSEKTWCGLFIWADCVQEELHERAISRDDDGDRKMNFAWRMGKMEADIRNIKFITQVLGFGFLVVVVFVGMALLKG
ncbi:hypothetical protein Ahy_B02g061165 [Arachis hypogaea]|uniref:Zinc finger GRF-type domain-containing protein n=1 Tax=Arachis hypogaea TaxID=3818 RepID=A0A445AKD4_ARAHY|nr:hypothetical protein Ahy_B02g061165 [Arachis hypogaea]